MWPFRLAFNEAIMGSVSKPRQLRSDHFDSCVISVNIGIVRIVPLVGLSDPDDNRAMIGFDAVAGPSGI
jgi:hypothetical protein